MKTPKAEIFWIVGRIHVGTPDNEIIDNFRARCKRAGASPQLTSAVIRYALKCHRDNQALYARVTRGGM